ncbi:hypothetical protein ACBY01_15075 [Sphingomonas sp. ac-8]|uniref:hypothetical protein n=1 Tax=Sphingomonas sp. ac-8 TaxID=3242977 RepID=UPI003A812536
MQAPRRAYSRARLAPLLFAPLLVALSPVDEAALDPSEVREVDAIECRLDAPSYQRFAMALEGEEDLARKRGWKKVASANPLLLEYDLPAPIVVAGDYRTRRIGFSGSGILAILDLADPAVVANRERIANAADIEPMIDALVAEGRVTRAEAERSFRFRKFLGERVVADVTEPAKDGETFGSHTVVARSISNATTHPGKTFYGCSYRIEILDADGTPL